MHVLCAPADFKETISAAQAADAMVQAVHAFRDRDQDRVPTIRAEACPVADGGEGTLDALVGARAGRVVHREVHGPLVGVPHARRSARYAILDRGRGPGVVELAEASGLALVPLAQRSPLRTTTYGTGELIAAVTAHDCDEVIVGLGGSATIDAGTGILQALGGRFFDVHGRPMMRPMTGSDLARVLRFEPPISPTSLRVACDVDNPLYGPDGAAVVYGPQKGASADDVASLDAALERLAEILGVDPHASGAGAAGGAGFGLLAIGATLTSGIDLVLEAVHFVQRCAEADLVLTGEGRLDAQSLHGKAAIGVARAAVRAGVPAIAIVGDTGPGAERCTPSAGGPLQRVISLTERFGQSLALARPAECLQQAVTELLEEMLVR